MLRHAARMFCYLTIAVSTLLFSGFRNGTEISSLDANAKIVGMIYIQGTDKFRRCTGVLLSPTVVMTSEMCIHDRPVSSLRFVNAAGRQLTVKGVKVHPQLKYKRMADTTMLAVHGNIALLSLETSAVPVGVNAAFPRIVDKWSVRQLDQVIGFGFGEVGDSSDQEKSVAKLPKMTKGILEFTSLKDDHLWFVAPEDKVQSIACIGDGGAPLFKWNSKSQGVPLELIAMVSYAHASQTACVGFKSTYAIPLSDYQDWINANRNGGW